MELFPLPSIKPQSLGIRALCLNQNVTGNRLGPEIDWGRFYSLFNSKRPAPSPHSHTPILETAKCIMNRRDPNLTQSYLMNRRDPNLTQSYPNLTQSNLTQSYRRWSDAPSNSPRP